MSTNIINYTLDSATPKNANGTFPGVGTNIKVVTGPGTHAYGNFPKAVEFAANSSIKTPIPANTFDKNRFVAQVLFKPKASQTGIQTLVDCNSLPFNIFLNNPGVTPAYVGIQLKTVEYGATTADTLLRTTTLNMAGWNSLELLFDNDVMVLLLNGVAVSAASISGSELSPATGTQLVLGQNAVAPAQQFHGQMAAFRFFNGLTLAQATQAASARLSPEWHIHAKYVQFKDFYTFGNPASNILFDEQLASYTKRWDSAMIIAPVGAGTAYEMHGLIYAAYKADPSLRLKLGVPISDEQAGARAGSRKNMFTKGAIYFSDATGAKPVLGTLYSEYEGMGEGGSIIGLPIKAEVAVSGGKMQEFQNGHMYHRDGNDAAFEIHGLILNEFKAKGGLTRYGFPISNETPLKAANGTTQVGVVSEFEKGNIYFSDATGAKEVLGSSRTNYNRIGGHLSPLGFPTSHETALPGAVAGSVYNTFQHGMITRIGGQVRIACPFQIFVGRARTKEDEGAGAGKNDPYFRVKVLENGVEKYNKRFPDSGYYNEKPTVDLNTLTNVTFYPNAINKSFVFDFEAWDYDSTNPNDHLGKFTYTLDAKNAFGWMNTADGNLASGPFKNVYNVDWQIRPVAPTPATNTFWKTGNPSTDPVTWTQCSDAFRDIDPTPESWDMLDELDEFFYDKAIKGVAKRGSCYGVATYAGKCWNSTQKHYGALDKYTLDAALRHEYTVHQARQWGDRTVDWVTGLFFKNLTQDPKQIFALSKAAFDRGEQPVMCFTDGANLLRQKGHCVLPVAWDNSAKPWKIKVHDPNNTKGTLTDIIINPDTNTWSFQMSTLWSGGFRTGGRLYYIPYTTYAPRPRTPYLAALGRIDDLINYVLSEHVETVSLVDESGRDISGSNIVDGTVAAAQKSFLPIMPLGAEANFTGTLLVRPGGTFPSAAAIQALKASSMPNWSSINLGDGFTHQMKGRLAGNFTTQLIQNFNFVTLQGQIAAGEAFSFGAKNFASPGRLLTIKSPQARTYTLEAGTKLGGKEEGITAKLSGFSVKANTDAKISIDPSLGTLDIVTGGAAVNTVLEINGKIGVDTFRRTYDLKVEGGTRLFLREALLENVLNGGRIDNIMGNANQIFQIRAR